MLARSPVAATPAARALAGGAAVVAAGMAFVDYDAVVVVVVGVAVVVGY